MKFIFSEPMVEKDFFIFFLCGAEYDNKNADSDKRIILKNYLKSNPKIFPIILEENFIMRRNKKGYLAYDQIYMTNLLDVENLMCLFSDFIIIIHETLSTAGELGVFASNSKFFDRILVLVPDRSQVEESKMSGFLKGAFQNISAEYFYPKVKTKNISPYLTTYHTFFSNNTIGINLSSNIKNYITKCTQNSSINLKINKIKGSPNIRYKINHLGYYIQKKSRKLKIFLKNNEIFFHIISFFSQHEILNQIREKENIKDLVCDITSIYKNTIINTICEKEKIKGEDYEISFCFPFDTKIEIKSVIGYVFYLLQAMGLLSLPSNGAKMVISHKIRDLAKKYSSIIKKYEGIDISNIIGDEDE